MAIGCATFLKGTVFDNNYANDPEWSDNQYSTINFFTYFLLVNTLLPISLQVCMEFCKFFQSFYINNDMLMYSWDRWKFVECKSMPLVEEIG